MIGQSLLILVVFLVLLWHQVTQPLWRSSVGLEIERVDPADLADQVHVISNSFSPRDAAHPNNLAALADYLAKEFQSTGAKIKRQSYPAQGHAYHNIIASYGPDEGERIVVGAHYDTAGEQPGADDNASGIAGLIALARLLNGATLSRPVDLVAYPLEEPPNFRTQNMGSAVHARSLRERSVQVRMMIALEMIGYFSDEIGSQHYPLPVLRWLYPDRGNFIAVVGRFFGGSDVRPIKQAMRGGSDLPVYSLNAPRSVPGVDFSDHANYWNEGYPAVMITDTAFYRNPYYHTVADTADRLDYARMAKVVAGVFSAVRQLANNER